MNNSCVLICTAANADRINEEVGLALGDLRISPISGEIVGSSRNLSRALSANGTTITHFGGHGWFTDAQWKLLSKIAGLTIQAAVLDKQPHDNWLVALKTLNAAPVTKERGETELTVKERQPPKNEARIVAAKTAFDVKDKEPKPKPPEVPKEPPGKPKGK